MGSRRTIAGAAVAYDGSCLVRARWIARVGIVGAEERLVACLMSGRVVAACDPRRAGDSSVVAGDKSTPDTPRRTQCMERQTKLDVSATVRASLSSVVSGVEQVNRRLSTAGVVSGQAPLGFACGII